MKKKRLHFLSKVTMTRSLLGSKDVNVGGCSVKEIHVECSDCMQPRRIESPTDLLDPSEGELKL
jgi:hypothetical protein